jgi:hypothetical protein
MQSVDSSSHYSSSLGDSRPIGAYGLTFSGLHDPLLVPVPDEADWPVVRFRRDYDAHQPPERAISDARAALPLLGGRWILLDRFAAEVALRGPEDADETEILHPFLGLVAVVFSWWYGRNAFHGGAVAGPDRGAWAILGGRGAGKSSTLAALAATGLDVVADDLLVVDGARVYAGPRSIDLRLDATQPINSHAATDRVVRGSSRRRITLQAVRAESPLVGWVFLEWGAEFSLRRLRPSEWLERATSHLNTVSTTAHQSLLPLAEADAWELTRPLGPASLEATVDELRALVGR